MKTRTIQRPPAEKVAAREIQLNRWLVDRYLAISDAHDAGANDTATAISESMLPETAPWIAHLRELADACFGANNSYITDELMTHLACAWLSYRSTLCISMLAPYGWGRKGVECIHQNNALYRERAMAILLAGDATEAPLQDLLELSQDAEGAIEECKVDITRAFGATHIAHFQRLCEMYSQCESPLEQAFLLGYAAYNKDCLIAIADSTVFASQVPVGHYRVDFALYTRDGKHKVAVEVDGHTYHERTPEQASADRARDRTLQAEGWDVLRFHRMEIERDLWGCIKSLERHMQSLTPNA